MIEVAFKCRCMRAEQILFVPPRNAREELSDWMNMVQGAIGKTHSEISPLCTAREMEYAKILMEPGAEKVGGKGFTN